MIGSLLNNIRTSVHRYRSEPEFRELVSTSFASLLVRMIGTATGFLVTLVTSRYFGAGALGIVSICLGILVLAATFGKLGLDVSLLRFIAGFARTNDFGSIRGIYLRTIRIIIPLSLLLSCLLYLLADWMSDEIFHKPYLADILRLNAWFILPLVLIMIHSESVRGLKKVRSYTFFQTAAVSSIALIFLIAAFFSGYLHAYIPVYIQFISIGLAGLASLINWFKYSRFRTTKTIDSISTTEMLKVSGPMFTTTIMQLIMSWAGTLILAAYASESDVGVFNALTRISVFTNITFLAINSISMPRFAEAWSASDHELLRKHAWEAGRLILLTSLPIFIALSLFPEFILKIFGREFPGNEISLYILIAGQFIVVLAGLPAQILNMTGKQHLLRNVAIISAIINVAACFILIPEYGIPGVCIAQALGILVWNFSCVWIVKRHFGFYSFIRR
ncbi:MAG: hypothetical protein DWQ44_02815 [Bacteroidetes bacterium]|nr:MAG: hypothetical protein DWQ33_06545 [Bacteroidota bacterium]REK04900.1 MAG: hypothetical protein DWQ39_06710 [Bacteroidota bacterium]REK36372.1 MAG: hypothetical protein DWQ44_02815 [Bacteroidota bacterium]REK50962.1 MAG: hypothetical protein DWQ48_02405 [Bacteroidota bacterium]